MHLSLNGHCGSPSYPNSPVYVPSGSLSVNNYILNRRRIRAASRPVSRSAQFHRSCARYFPPLSNGGRPTRPVIAGSVGNLKTPRSVTSLTGGDLRRTQVRRMIHYNCPVQLIEVSQSRSTKVRINKWTSGSLNLNYCRGDTLSIVISTGIQGYLIQGSSNREPYIWYVLCTI